MFGVENCQILSNLRKYIEIYCISVIQILVSDTSHYENVPYTLPNGWCWCKLGDLCSFESGFAFSSNDFKTSGIPLVRISNIQDSTVTLKNCVFIQDEVDEKYIIKTGDLLIAMSGATTGKMGIYSMRQRALLNQRVGNICVQSRYLTANYRNYFMYSQSDVILKMAYGGAQPNISSQMILNIPIPLPPLSEQYRIVNDIKNLLEIVDRIEENQISLDKFLCSIKQKILQLAISGNLLTHDHNDEPAIDLLRRINPSYKPADNRHYENVPPGWAVCTFEDILDYEQPQKYIVSSTEYSDAYKIPVLTAGKSFIIGKTNENFGICERLPVIIFDDFTTDSKYVDFPFKVKSSAMKILRVKGNINPRYISYLMSITRLVGETHKRYWISEYRKIKIMLPPIEEQNRIVTVIENIYNGLDNILAEL